MTEQTALADKIERAEGLSEAHRVAWIRSILAMSGSEANRRAFMAGYNGNECPAPVTASKADAWRRGLAAYDALRAREASQ